MGYQILYGSTGDAKRMGLWRKRLKYAGIFAIAVLILITAFWISGGNWAVTVSAMEEMAATISRGEDFADAFSSFCLDILQAAEAG